MLGCSASAPLAGLTRSSVPHSTSVGLFSVGSRGSRRKSRRLKPSKSFGARSGGLATTSGAMLASKRSRSSDSVTQLLS